jgi:cytochrome oxidase assembly protein ShyY1
VYRFLATPRWLGLAAVILVLAAVMVGLGRWQLDRYHQRAAINHRIDAAATARPVPIGEVVRPSEKPAKSSEYTRVGATGRYDPAHEILVRARTVDGRVGFEVLTPLVVADGSAVLVDRGWVPPRVDGRARMEPDVPAAPAGEVSVSGVLRLPERAAGPVGRNGSRVEVRRIAPRQLAATLPYPVANAYVTVAQDGLVPIAAEHENAWQNAGYVVQWWAFAALALFGYGYLAWREARQARWSARTESIVSASDAGLSSR